MLKVHPKTRKECREEQQQNYLSGWASKPYCHTPTLNESFGKDAKSTGAAGPSTTHVEDSGGLREVCIKCKPVLSRYQLMFQSFVHQGSELKRRKSTNPHPKRPDMQHYRNLKAQNEWIRSNVFNAMGTTYSVHNAFAEHFSFTRNVSLGRE